ncbi:type III-B CRISPR module RAMP protein Cmr6 [Thermoflavimicrobium daqui]|uniref:Type III-B CRISPR module RAMP protein Cmr6 n=2 Tax=Thermoflavimicrobium daqui TaxID=2137476 RepID=A0A364K6W5_9BACL|nr:type III-B CRISPR module RAMP protein Cmr6 [Thermoflavimicrobium daqui]
MEDLIFSQRGKLFFMKTATRFVTGLGRSHPVENGFAWHPTLGTAYLPGSSIKGVVRNWAQEWTDTPNEIISRIFGSVKKNSGEMAGSIIFFDAIATAPIQLDMEILTPHFSPYYQDKANPPRDWYSPIPIPYLVVAKDQPFLFAIAPRNNDAIGQEDLERVEKWLKEALEWIGAGAKTALGYGRFKQQKAWQEHTHKRKEEQERKRALANLSPIEREMVEDGYDRDPNQFMAALTTKWLNRMEDESTPKAEQMEIAEKLARWYQQYKPKDWKKPKGKNEAKIKRIRVILDRENI